MCEFLLLCAYYIHIGDDDSIERKTATSDDQNNPQLRWQREREKRERI